MNRTRGYVRATVVRTFIEARRIRGVCAQFFTRVHKLVDVVKLNDPVLDVCIFQGNRLVTIAK